MCLLNAVVIPEAVNHRKDNTFEQEKLFTSVKLPRPLSINAIHYLSLCVCFKKETHSVSISSHRNFGYHNMTQRKDLERHLTKQLV